VKKNEHDFERLLNGLEGHLSVDETQKLEAQLETATDDTQALIEWLQEFQRLSQKYQLVVPPDKLDKQLSNIFTKRAEKKQRPHFFSHLLATLSFDSYQNLTSVGIRASAANKPERQLVFSTDFVEITIDSQWNAQEKNVNINGQLFPLDDADKTIYMVELQRNKNTMKMTPTDSLGKFFFTSVGSGTYDIILSSDQAEIVMTDIALQF
jgi:hypothetical protein